MAVSLESASKSLWNKLHTVNGFLTVGVRETKDEKTLVVYVDKSKNMHVLQNVPDRWRGYKVIIKNTGSPIPA